MAAAYYIEASSCPPSGGNTVQILVTPSALAVKIHHLFAILVFLAAMGIFSLS
jgi:hypothetical protein